MAARRRSSTRGSTSTPARSWRSWARTGPGKSTLIKILAGVLPLESGTVTHRGRDVSHALRRLPIAFIHQDLGLIEWMTVAENISLMLGFPRRFGLIDWHAVRTRAERALEAVGDGIDPDLRVHHLTRTEKSLVAIARALAADAEPRLIPPHPENKSAVRKDPVFGSRAFRLVERRNAWSAAHRVHSASDTHFVCSRDWRGVNIRLVGGKARTRTAF